jgi:hypothetical protein
MDYGSRRRRQWRGCLSFSRCKQAAGNDARYDARDEHGKIDCWHRQPHSPRWDFLLECLTAPMSDVSGRPPGGKEAGRKVRLGERGSGRVPDAALRYGLYRERLSDSCSRCETVAPNWKLGPNRGTFVGDCGVV